jgi:hypothetical protein
MTTTPYVPPVATPPPAAPQKSSGCLKWSLIGCGVVVVLFAAFCAVVAIFVFGAMKRSNVYKGAVERAQNDPRVKAALGEPIETGWWVSGSVHVDNGSGNAELTIPLSGPKESGKLHAIATIENGDWKYERLSVKPERGDRIDLNTPP